MTPEQAILAILGTVTGQTVRGKKRLQKLSYLWQASGVPIDAIFKIKYYGPFSTEIENSCALLSLFGDIEEREVSTGYADYLTTEYYLPGEEEPDHPPVSEDQRRLLVELDRFDTVDLEVASTVLFFMNAGSNLEQAVQKTKAMKPTKVNSRTIDSSKKIIAKIRE